MNKWIIITALLAIALTSCHQLSQRAEAEQSTDRTKVVTSADTLRLVIADKSLSQSDSVIRMTLNLPLDSIVVEMMNNTDSTCMTGEAYTIEQWVNGEWTVLPIKPRKDGAVYAFNDIYWLRTRSTQHPPVHYPRRFRQIRLRARTGIPHRQRVLQERKEGAAKRLSLFFI